MLFVPEPGGRAPACDAVREHCGQVLRAVFPSVLRFFTSGQRVMSNDDAAVICVQKADWFSVAPGHATR